MIADWSTNECPDSTTPSTGTAPAWPDDDDVAQREIARGDVGHAVLPADRHGAWQQVEEILDGTPSAVHRHVLQHLGDEHEENDDDRRERLADGECRDERNRHRQLHRHPPLSKGCDRFLVDRVTANHRRGERDRIDAKERLPREEPRHGHGKRYEPDANEITSVDVVLVLLPVTVRGGRCDSRGGDGCRAGHGVNGLSCRLHVALLHVRPHDIDQLVGGSCSLG